MLKNKKLATLAERVWRKGHVFPDRTPSGDYMWPPEVWRTDDFGNIIQHDEYGNRDSKLGWEIDHITPKSNGGTDDISNLRPLHWEENVARNQV